MPLKTTVVGAWPKPDYLKEKLDDWFATIEQAKYNPTRRRKDDTSDDEIASLVDQARTDVITKQMKVGLDIITDGEIERETYYLHLGRNLNGIDFDNVKEKEGRNGACTFNAPIVRGKLELKGEPVCWEEWAKAVKVVDEIWSKKEELCLSQKTKPVVKYTIPGPMTLLEGLDDQHYGPENRRQLIEDTIHCIRQEIVSLVEHGCKVIQLDEPVLMRHPEAAIDYGIRDATGMFKGIPGINEVTTILHLCCGYPNYLDQKDYMKADKENYVTIAKLLDNSGISQVSIEDSEACNDLDRLLPCFKNISVMLGSVKIACSDVETSEQIEKRLREAKRYIDEDRLIVTPDCGLGFLPENLIMEKLSNMINAAKNI